MPLFPALIDLKDKRILGAVAVNSIELQRMLINFYRRHTG